MAKVNHVKLTCPEVEGLKDPFTGKDLSVFAHICEGVVTYSAPEAFSLAVPQLTIEKLMKRASTRGNIVGAADEDERMIDPYTGEQLTLAGDKGAYYLVGGFDPTVGCMDLNEFIEKVSCGRRHIGTPPKAESVVEIPDLTPNDDDDAAHKVVDEETEKAAHEIVKVIPGADKGRNTVGYRAPAKGKSKK